MAQWIHDRRGQAKIIFYQDRFLDSHGRTIGWISGINMFSLRGRHVGWFENGVLYDGRNKAIGFLRDHTGQLPSTPGIGGIPGMPGIAGVPGRPGFSGVPGRPGKSGWSDIPLEALFVS